VEIWWLIYILISPQAQLERVEYVADYWNKKACILEMDRGLKLATLPGEWLACIPGKGVWI